MKAEYDVFLYGQNRSGGLDFTQDSGMGVMASVFAVRQLSGEMGNEAFFELFFQYWDVDDSSTTVVEFLEPGYEPVAFIEPSNNSSMWGIRAAIEF